MNKIRLEKFLKTKYFDNFENIELFLKISLRRKFTKTRSYAPCNVYVLHIRALFGTLQYKEFLKNSNFNFFKKSHITEIATCTIELLDIKNC